MAGCADAGADAAPARPTFGDVAPIVRRHCAGCHQPEGVAPFPLVEYEDVRARAAAIAVAVRDGIMPPWLPGEAGVPLAGDRRLDAGAVKTILRWVEQGMPVGDTTDLPSPPRLERGWHLGEPDMVLELREPYTPPAHGLDVFRNFVLPVALDSTRYVRAVEFRMDPPGAVHHAMLMVDPTAASRRLDADDPEPGYEGGMLMHSAARSPDGHFIGWTPGKAPAPASEGLAWRLDPGTDLVLQLHLRPQQQAAAVRPMIGLHFADGPPHRIAAVIRLGSESLDIPAGERAYVMTDSFTLPVAVEAVSAYPHAHYLATSMLVTATPPGGDDLVLLSIPRWNFDWQDEYRFARPVPLPRGTVLRIRYVYDNSAANPRNPNHPPRRVLAGPQSADEMGDLWLQVVVRDSAEHRTLRGAIFRKHVEIRRAGLEQALRVRPDSAEAHLDLGNIYLRDGNTREAIAHYRQVLRVRPDDALAHYHLGVAFQTEERLDEAVSHYRSAVRADPEFADAHLNLGTVLLALRRTGEAAAALAMAAELAPDRADARHALGVALVRAGRVGEAIAHLREALRLQPAWRPAALELAWTLATHPDAPADGAAEAIALAEGAARASGYGDPVSLHVLAAAVAAGGDYGRAAALAREAFARASGDPSLSAKIEALLAAFQADLPYRERP